VEFEWDRTKAASNHQKHGIRFENAVEAFYDPLEITVPAKNAGGELRWQTVGSVDGMVISVISARRQAPDGSERIRLISARHASRRERADYEQQ